MRSPRKKTFLSPSDLLRAYRQADERTKYLHDTDEKLFVYQNVLDFCFASKKCLKNQSVQKQQILFWTYRRMGDLFLQKNLDTFEQSNQIHALQAYQNALELANDRSEQFDILTKMRDIYRQSENNGMSVRTSVQMANLVDDALKIEMFLNLADEAPSKKEEIYFLEQALKFVTEEKISTLKQCEHTLAICARLLKIYEKAGKKADISRISYITNQTRDLMQTQHI